jgi:hypothetical protein
LKRSRWVALTSVAVALVLLGSCGGGTKIPEFNATPTVSGLFPSNITAGSDSFIMTVSGTGFQSNSQGVTFVYWNGSARSTNFDNATGELAVQILASDVANANGNMITVTAANPTPGGGMSITGQEFTVVPPQAGLTIASLAPTNMKAGQPAFSLTVNGTGFATNDIVTWNGSPRTTTIMPMNTTVATANITADDILTAGSASVAVSTPGQLIATPSLSFAITGPDNPAPKASSLSPSSMAHGGGDFQMRVDGSGFTATSFVTWNGGFRATAFISSSQLVALISAADIAATGSANVGVTNPPPGGGSSSTETFTIN